MGCCISKCNRKRKRQEDDQHSSSHVQDKMVISQPQRISPIIPLPSSTKQLPPRLSPIHSPLSTSSVSSFSCTASSNSSSSCSSTSSLSSRSSSMLFSSSKEKAFSNEFLWSCVKENPHIIHINDIANNGISLQKPLISSKGRPQKLGSSSPAKAQNGQLIRHVGSTTPQKRARPNSPTISRQKSFRRDQPLDQRPNSGRNLSSSPSPSRRFASGGGDNYKAGLRSSSTKNNLSSPKVSKSNAVGFGLPSSGKKENLRPPSPKNNSSRYRPCLMNRETCTYRIGSKIDEVIVGEVVAGQDVDVVPMEDIDNPLIALDCFIFV